MANTSSGRDPVEELAESDPDDLTRTGDVLGTLRYIAPERLDGQGDARSDVYSLGLTLYELLTLRPAFDEADRDRLLQRVMHAEPVAPRRIDPSIPRDLETIVLKAIAREPARRYPAAAALAEDLRRYLADEPIQARPVSGSERTWRWCRRNPAVASLAALAAGLVVAFAVVSTTAAIRLKSQRDTARSMSRTLAAQGRTLRAEHQKALASETLARTALASARDEAARANRLLYLSDLRLVQRLWDSEDGTPRAMADLLTRHIPRRAGEPDLREFAWRFQFTRILSNEVLTPWAGSAVAGALGADGQVAMLDRSGMLRLLDPAGYQVVAERDLSAGTHPACLALSRDGSAVALGIGSRLRVVDSRSGRDLAASTTEGSAAFVETVFSPTGQFVAGLRADRQVLVLEVATGRQVAAGQMSAGSYRTLALTSDGLSVIVGDHPAHGAVTVYDLARARATRLKGNSGATVMQVAGSPDGRLIAAGFFNGVVLFWDAATGAVQFRLRAHLARVSRVCFSDNSRWVYTGSFDGSVAVWDTVTRSNITRLKGHATEVVFLAPATAPGSSALVTGARNRVIRFWDMAGASRPSRPSGRPVPGPPCLAFSPDGRILAERSESVRLWDTRSWTSIKTLGAGNPDPPEPPDRPTCLAFTPDGDLLAVGDQASRVTLRDVSTGAVVRRLEGVEPAFYGPPSPRFALITPRNKRRVSALAVSPDAAMLAVGYGLRAGYIADYDQVVKLFDLRSGLALATLPVVNSVAWLHFSPDGKALTAAGHDGSVRRWRTRGWEPAERWIAGTPVFSAAVSRDESRLATGLASGRIAVWDLATGRELHRMPGHANFVAGATFSADGRTLVTSSGTSEYGMFKFWDLASGGELLQLWLEAPTYDIAISPTTDVLAGVGPGGLRHWDVWPLDRIERVIASHQSQAHGQGTGGGAAVPAAATNRPASSEQPGAPGDPNP